MSILDDLAKQDQPTDLSDRQYCENGMLTMHDDLFQMQLEELGVEQDIIADAMLEPVVDRDDWIKYFKGRGEGINEHK